MDDTHSSASLRGCISPANRSKPDGMTILVDRERDPMNMMTNPSKDGVIDLASIATTTAQKCIATRVRQLSRIVTRVYDDAMRPHGCARSECVTVPVDKLIRTV